MDDYRKRLGLPERFTEQDLDRAFRERALLTHPDRGGSAASFNQLVTDYEIAQGDLRRASLHATHPIREFPIPEFGNENASTDWSGWFVMALVTTLLALNWPLWLACAVMVLLVTASPLLIARLPTGASTILWAVSVFACFCVAWAAVPGLFPEEMPEEQAMWWCLAIRICVLLSGVMTTLGWFVSLAGRE